MEEHKPLPLLNSEEARVIGVLLEKAKTTPEYYPLTLNGLQTACNQKTSRRPVVQYEENTIIVALDSLRKLGLVSTVVGGGSRSVKYKHNLAIQYPLLPQELAIICLLLLRGPLTAGEINSNAGRLYDFESIDEVSQLLSKLESHEPSFVKIAPKRTGQKEIRYIQLLTEFNEEEYESDQPSTRAGSSEQITALTDRVANLEQQLEQLQTAFDKLMSELT
ncbi:YceH family protein [Sphingobacterium sp. lm-10]|uniref:YceH family protein n=1 Tax=Sphingobacterium sp. lm-10 TaxID=2944904 RepID=UPI0020201F52|nr:YceH family protein [Sphingobacterium sp. lm-10]MCL7986887.1 YceH family protein [Sphingobacterium sp. lm-10]